MLPLKKCVDVLLFSMFQQEHGKQLRQNTSMQRLLEDFFAGSLVLPLKKCVDVLPFLHVSARTWQTAQTQHKHAKASRRNKCSYFLLFVYCLFAMAPKVRLSADPSVGVADVMKVLKEWVEEEKCSDVLKLLTPL